MARKKSRIKGLIFESFYPQNQGPGGASGRGPQGQKGMVWLPHQGRMRRIKNLRISCRRILEDRTPAIMDAVDRLEFATSTEPEPEYGKLALVFKVMELSDSNGIPFPEMTDLFLAMVTKAIETHTEKEHGSFEGSVRSDHSDDSGHRENGAGVAVESLSQDSDAVPVAQAGDPSIQAEVSQEAERV